MSTIDQIAQRLGLSIATVSRALNGKEGVKQETRGRILALAAEIDYVPSMAARSLATQTTQSIGFLCSVGELSLWTDPFYLHVMHGAERELTRLGYFLLVHTVIPQNQTSVSEIQLLREKRVDGLILASPFFLQKFVLSIKSIGIPMVLVDNDLQNNPVDSIQIADEDGGYIATRHLQEHGHRWIASLTGNQSWVSCRNRTTGYKRAMLEAGLPTLVEIQNVTNQESGYAAMMNVFKREPRITAIFSQNDAMAVGAMQAARELGKCIPEDLAIIGFDDIELACHTTPALTTMRVPKEYLGTLAARRIVDLLTLPVKPGQPAVTNRVATELIIRSSCGCSA